MTYCSHSYQYDAWDNLTGRAVNRFWSGGEPFTDTYVNQRKQGSQYDAQGNETWDDYGLEGRTHTYDAAGRKVKTSERSQSAGGGAAMAQGSGKDTASTSAAGGGGVYPHMPEGGYYTTTTLTITQGYDGGGRSTKRVETKVQHTPWFQPVTTERVDYYVRSSVLGGRVITELKGGGQKAKTKVYAGGEVIAEQDVYAGGAQGLTWKQRNPMTGTEVEQNTANGVTQRKEYDPFGLELGASDPYLDNAEPDYASFGGGSYYRSGGNPFGDSGYLVDGMPRSYGEMRFLLGNNLVEQCPENRCGPRVVTNGREERFAPLERDPRTGELGYRVPNWVDDGYDDLDIDHPNKGDGVERVYTDIQNKGHWEYLPAQATAERPFLIPEPDWRVGINNLLNNPACASFVSRVIYRASGTSDTLVSPTILGVFNKLSKSGNVIFVPGGVRGPNGEVYNGQAPGSFAGGDARIEISSRYVPMPASPENARWVIGRETIQYSQTALGETIHKASRNGFSDRDLARAASKETGIPGLPLDDNYLTNSFYFHHTVLRSICK